LKHGISLLLHIGPIHIQLLSYWILLVLDYCEVPICMEIIPKPVIVKVGGPLVGVFMSIDHRLILSPCEIRRPARVTTIHSPQSVLIIYPEWTFNFLNYRAFPCFSCFVDSTTFGNICSLLINLGGACVTSPSSFPCFPPWARGDHKVIISA
jgi:hypothetical protein